MEANVGSGEFFYKYRFNVWVRNGGITLKIKDREGDCYTLWCCRSVWHFVDYNSSDATIVKISY